MQRSYQTTALIFLLILISFKSLSQDISGTWTGNYGGNFLTIKPQKLVVEIFLYNDSLISGASHLYYRNNKYEHYRIRGVYHKRDSSFIFKEDSTIALKLGIFVTNSLGTYKTKLFLSDSVMRQQGKWKDNEKFLGAGTSTVWLEKKLPFIKKGTSLNKERPTEQKVIPAPDNILFRETDIQSLIEIADRDKDSIKIAVYDNGIVDDDSVSVYADNNSVFVKQRISSDPIVFFVSLDKSNPISKIRMVAESLGSIPPCTALMVITTKNKRYEVNLSSNFNKNATVELFLK